MKNRLPECWAVKNDGSQDFKDFVIAFLNDCYKQDWVGDTKDMYYGIIYNDKSGNKSSNMISVANPNLRYNTILTLNEFKRLSMYNIDGYKLNTITPFHTAVINHAAEGCIDNGFVDIKQTKAINILSSSGLLDLWFKPVYKNKSIDAYGVKVLISDDYKILTIYGKEIPFEVFKNYDSKYIESITVSKGILIYTKVIKEIIRKVNECISNSSKGL